MPFTDWATGDVITATKLDNDNTVSVGTDTARTISVTHTWTASQTFTGGLTTGAASTLSGNLLFTDATYDIGASGATRPRDLYLSRNAVIGNNLTTGGTFTHTASPVSTATVAISTTASVPDITGAVGGGTHVVVSSSAANVCTLHVAAIGSQAPRLLFQRGKGSFAAATAVQSGDQLGVMDFGGYDGTNYWNPSCAIMSTATENWSDTANGGQLIFKTTANTTASQANALVLGQDLSATFGGAATIPGTTYIGDTANAKVTLGLTINQAANDDEILSLKSSDIAHGITDTTETDTYAYFKKLSATAGGLTLAGLSEGTRGLSLAGFHTTDNTTKSTAADGAVLIDGLLKSGTGVAVLGADANILVVRNGSSSRFIVDQEGTPHSDEAAATF